LHGSTDVLERIDKATPLHLAVQIQHTELRLYIFDSLLEAGADTSCVQMTFIVIFIFIPFLPKNKRQERGNSH